MLKCGTEIIDLVVLGRNYWSSCRVSQQDPLLYHDSLNSAKIIKENSSVFTVSETNNDDKTELRLTITLMFITILFIVTTTPTVIYHISKFSYSIEKLCYLGVLIFMLMYVSNSIFMPL